ncbi:hypothetical protein Cgig2_007788 [Carnegiea gigantea]|uniref:Uncharacterized protein n=1 Tax=Carnegiea gigantea TaxID=171969 RepID=A0A9Q1GYL1_9CARY|nr:hypothetical protein Cgig2_007788 [Carnegiea gigantea]
MAYEQMSTPTARLRAVEVELEKHRTRAKQSKVNSSWFKAAKNKTIKAFGSCVVDTNVPFTLVDSVYSNPLLETIYVVGADARTPSAYELSASPNVIMRSEPDVDKQIKAMRQIAVNQQPQDMQSGDCESEEHLSPSSSHGGSGGGGDGGNGGANKMSASYSSRPSTDYFTNCGCGVTLEDDGRSRRSLDEQPREPTQTHRHVRKGKEPIQPRGYPTDAISTNRNFPPPPYPSHEPQFVGSDSSRRHRDNPLIINQGTINYGDHHYHQPTFYSSNSTSSEQSWMDSTVSSIFYPQQESYGADQNNNDTY